MRKTGGKAGEAKTKQSPRSSASAKMSLNHLRPPLQMKIPSRVDLKRSTVDENILGVWSKRPFKKGEVFGPFMGKKVMDATEDMDPSYVWEIVDKETKEFLFYIDATDLRNANWMRYINCARHFDEQNIISEQIDVDIFYKVIKDIPPGEELLTWYKKPKLRKKQNRKRQLSCASPSGSGEKTPRKTEKTPGKADRSLGRVDRMFGKADKTPVKVTRHSSSHKGDVHENGVASNKVKVEAVMRREDETPERDMGVMKTPPKKALKLSRTSIPVKRRRKSRSGRDPHRRIPASVVVKPEDSQAESLVNGYFQFNMKDYHMVKGRSGRRLFRCDICSSVYRHAFSLKRHYIRSHINYFFVSKMDRLNCNVSQPEEGTTASDKLNFTAETDNDLRSDGVGEEGVSTEGYLHSGCDVDKTDVGGKCGSEQQGLVAPEEPDCKRRRVSSDAEQGESCDILKSDGVDKDKLASADGQESSKGDAGEKKLPGVADVPDSNDAHDATKCAVDTLDKENSALDDSESIGNGTDNTSVGTPEKNISSSVDDRPAVRCCQNSAPHKDTNILSITGECKSSTVKNTSDDGKPCVVDQPSSRQAPSTEDSAPGDKKDTVGRSAADGNKSSSTKEPDQNSTDPVTCAPDKEMSSSDKDNLKNSAADEKNNKENGVVNEKKLGTESSVEYKCAGGKVNGTPSEDKKTKNTAPSNGQCPENGTLRDDCSHENGAIDGESCSVDSDMGNVKREESSGMTDHEAADASTEQKHSDSAPDECDNIDGASHDNCAISNEPQHQQSDVTCDMSDVTKQSDDNNAPFRGSGIALVYRCHICHCHLGTKLELKQHLMEHSQDSVEERSADTKVFACDQCDMTFLSVQNLARHQTVHSGEKPFVCRYCNKKFPTVTNQRRHERIHQGRRFCCGHCQRSFTQTGDLKKHISKLHPELFHECVLCGKYFGSDDQLEEHLGSHGNSVRQNWKAVSMERGTHRANLELDRAESMKLATVKSGANFACTVCRKLFDDYANMCRHRRLAHQRNSILNVRVGRPANRCCVKTETFAGDDDLSNSINTDESEDAFYARIAENISDNLTNFLEGKKIHLDNCYEHINEKLRPSSQPVSQRRRRSSSDVTRINVAQYNFPKTFRLRSSRAIENCDKQDKCNEKDRGEHAAEQTPAADKAAVDSSTAANFDATTDAELMHVPKVRQCVQCRRNFHTFKSYREHMYIRHKTLVPDDVNKSEDWRNEQPSSPSEHDDIAAPLLSHKLLNNSTDIPTTTTTTTASTTNKSKLSYSGWKNGLLTGVKKDACSVGDGADELGALDACDMLLPDDELSQDKDTDIDKPFNYKLNLVARCYICNVCNEQFSCFDSLLDHQYDLHPNVYCTHLEVAVNGRPASWLQTAPVGLLRVTTNHVPAVEDFKRNMKSKFRCTKCNKPFTSMLELHTHITECATEGMPIVEPQPVIVKRPAKFKVKTIKGRKKTNPYSPTRPLSPGYETFHADDLDGSHDSVQERQRKKRRKNFELLYNPLHHVRRRELTQVLEIHNCGGCHQHFETISLLERHVRICKEKDKLKELRAISASLDVSVNVDDDEDDENAYDPTKHMCIYCLRQFTYLGMLRKHVTEWCQVRQDFIEHGDLLDDEWEETLEVKGKKKEGKLSRQSSFSSLNGGTDSQDVDEGNKKGMKPKWGTKWKHRTKEVDEPAVKLENESSTDSFSEQLRSVSGSEESRGVDGVESCGVDDVESSQQSAESKEEETVSSCKINEKETKPFSGLLKTSDKADETIACVDKDITKSEVEVQKKDCNVDGSSSRENVSGSDDVKLNNSETEQPIDRKRRSERLETAVVTSDIENASKKSQNHESGDNGKCKLAQSCDIAAPPSTKTSINIPKSGGLAKVM